jgi:hypothetical protein
MVEKLGGDWRRALIEQLVDNLQEVQPPPFDCHWFGLVNHKLP